MIEFGIDVLLNSMPGWKSSNIAMVTNQAATTVNGKPSRVALLHKGFHITKLFSPEHGLMADGADGKSMTDGTDQLTQLPIISLYGDKLTPSPEDLKDADIVLFDIPDIGCRFYTYLWSMTYLLETCAALNKKLVILDRPNPLSGNLNLAEGPMLDEPACSGFTGRWRMPLRHSCTIGELALYFNETRRIGAPLEVVHCKGWQREFFFADWGTPFIPTSPAIKHFNAALLYPGLGLLEATNLSEGRGTNQPFEVAGAPWLMHTIIAEQFNKIQSETELEICHFTPAEGKYAGKICNGIKFRVKNTSTFKPVFTAMLLIKLIKDLHAVDFKWSAYPTHVNPDGKEHLDKLTGVQNAEELFELPFNEFRNKIGTLLNVDEWSNLIRPFLLYPTAF